MKMYQLISILVFTILLAITTSTYTYTDAAHPLFDAINAVRHSNRQEAHQWELEQSGSSSSAAAGTNLYAICTFTTPSNSNISGTIKFVQYSNGGALVAIGSIKGLPIGNHGW